MTEELQQLHQDTVDGHGGDTYRYGDDPEGLDALHDRRLALLMDRWSGDEDEFSDIQEYIAEAREALVFPDVQKRLTTHQRRARGMSDTKKL